MRNPKQLSVPVRNILLVPRRKLGDLILATPMIDALIATFPKAHIDVCVNDYNASAVATHPHVHKLHIVQRQKFARNMLRPLVAPLHSLLSVWQMWRSRYDLMVFSDTNPRMTALSLLWLVQPRHSVCCAYKNHIKRFPVDTLVAPKNVQHLHVVERNLAILKAIGVHTVPPPPPLRSPLFLHDSPCETNRYGVSGPAGCGPR